LLGTKQFNKHYGYSLKSGLEEIGSIDSYMLDPDFRYAIEVRHRSWFDNKDVSTSCCLLYPTTITTSA
jgi:uncharacterized protein YecE (DUF72 family)